MTPNRQFLPTALTLAALIAGPAATASTAQEVESTTDQRVMIWRTGGDHTIDIEAVSGRRGYLGVGLLDLTPELRAHFGVPADRGIMISTIAADSPAERAGLLPADILTSADGEPLPAAIDLSMRVARIDEGAEIELERWREGQREVVSVPVEARPHALLDISPLIVRRISINPGQKLEIEKSGETEFDLHWVEEVVHSVGDSFSEASFIQQLEALRRERNGLLEKLRQMEGRLEEFEGELHLLDSDGD